MRFLLKYMEHWTSEEGNMSGEVNATWEKLPLELQEILGRISNNCVCDYPGCHSEAQGKFFIRFEKPVLCFLVFCSEAHMEEAKKRWEL
jgi:hypothetical protein